MSYFANTDVSTNEKRVLPRIEHLRLIRELQFGNFESTSRSLMKFSLDKTLKESKNVIKILESLCDASPIGVIIEWTVRFLKNQLTDQKIQPIQFTFARKIVEEGKPVRRNLQKAVFLGLQFLRYQAAQKNHQYLNIS